MDARKDHLIKRFASLSQIGKIELLTRLAHDETVYMRIGLLKKPPAYGPIRRSNELIHQICNHNFQVLGINRYLSDADTAESLLENFEERGENGFDILERAMKGLKISD